jgi:hypothetical protein
MRMHSRYPVIGDYDVHEEVSTAAVVAWLLLLGGVMMVIVIILIMRWLMGR